MDIGNNLEIWQGFIQATYLKDAMTYEGKCPTCRSPKNCNNYFCVHCKVGGLCPVAFRAGGEHHRHRWLQVRRQSRMCAVDPDELAAFVGKESTKHIQKCSLNGGFLCYLTRTKTEEGNSSPIGRSNSPGSSSKRPRSHVNILKACAGCNRWIPNSMNNIEEFLVCCLQCLTTVAQREPVRNLLQLKDGALDLTDVFPQTALEKTGCSAKPGDQVAASTCRELALIDAPGGAAVRDGEPRGRGCRRGAAAVAAVEPDLRVITEAEFTVARGNRPPRRTARHSARQIQAEPSAARLQERDLLPGEGDGTRAGGSGGAGDAGFQVADLSALPRGYRCEEVFNMIGAFMGNGEWDRLLGQSGRD